MVGRWQCIQSARHVARRCWATYKKIWANHCIQLLGNDVSFGYPDQSVRAEEWALPNPDDEGLSREDMFWFHCLPSFSWILIDFPFLILYAGKGQTISQSGRNWGRRIIDQGICYVFWTNNEGSSGKFVTFLIIVAISVPVTHVLDLGNSGPGRFGSDLEHHSPGAVRNVTSRIINWMVQYFLTYCSGLVKWRYPLLSLSSCTFAKHFLYPSWNWIPGCLGAKNRLGQITMNWDVY